MIAASRPHRRFNPLSGEWVLVSPQRTARPWQGQLEAPPPPPPPAYDPGCYLCPGNTRVQGAPNPNYTGVFAFDNDFPALVPQPAASSAGPPLLRAEAESGAARVLCYSPRHDLTLARLPLPAIEAVVAAWTAEYRALGARADVQSISIFENRGAMMGASNPHPHGQIWANSHLPHQIARELANLAEYRARNQACLLCDYLALELERGERIVCANPSFVALVPWWANWPFEALLLSRSHAAGLDHLDRRRSHDLAAILQELFRRYDALFQVDFPNSWGFHLPPTDGASHPECHLHAHFYPPLLRSASIRKFMVGYELLAMPQRDLTPEAAAERLRASAATADRASAAAKTHPDE